MPNDFKRYLKRVLVPIAIITIGIAFSMHYYSLPTIRNYDLLYDDCRHIYDKYWNPDEIVRLDRSLWPRSVMNLRPDVVLVFHNGVELRYRRTPYKGYLIDVGDRTSQLETYHEGDVPTKHPRVFKIYLDR